MFWFHNRALRQAIYCWKPKEDLQENAANSSDRKDKLYEPRSCIGHLQLLFGLLQCSKRKYLDPGPFIKFLELDTTEQQDAQEFNNLFLSMLQQQLSTQSDHHVKHIVQNLLCGSYHYITVCDTCRTESSRLSKFYELDLHVKGHKNLYECIAEFLKEEKLEGSDQYFCNLCNAKRNATRHIKLDNLPPVLNLQLLRFVFDRKSGRKKKINSFIKFPEILDFSSYSDASLMDDSIKNARYKLSAVLMHVSTTANSGHYFSYICDQSSSQWFIYNDQNVEKMDKLKLDTEEIIMDETVDEKNSSKKPKVMKGEHASNAVYMLVYNKITDMSSNTLNLLDTSRVNPTVNCDINTEDMMIPPYLVEVIRSDNESFLERVSKLEEMKNDNLQKYESKQQEIHSIYESLLISHKQTNLNNYEFLPLDWLSDWLSNKSGNEPIDNSQYMCKHSKLNPDFVANMKCVDSLGASQLYSLYDGGPRLIGEDALCWQCVRSRCSFMRMKLQTAKDRKSIADLLRSDKCKSKSEKEYWVGKSSLKSWRRLLLEQFDEESGETEDDSEDFLKRFNDDLLCEHDSLSVEVDRRRTVPYNVWKILHKYFPEAAVFESDVLPCNACLMKEENDSIVKQEHKLLASELRSTLFDICIDRNRPFWSDAASKSKFYVVSDIFVSQLRDFIRNPLRCDRVTFINNKETLMCEHDKLIYPPHVSKFRQPDSRLVFLWNHEWDIIKQNFTYDIEISVEQRQESFTDSNSQQLNLQHSEIISNPIFCEECHCRKISSDLQKNLNYTSAKIYIRKILKCEANLSTSISNDTSSQDSSQNGDTDSFSDFIPSKKMKTINDGTNSSLISCSDVNFRRQSNRHRKQRGEKEFTVSSTQTLKQLQHQITQKFCVLASDQCLTLNGQKLTQEDATLSSLHVTPGCVITLTVDDIYHDDTIDSLPPEDILPEVGFKGSKLLMS